MRCAAGPALGADDRFRSSVDHSDRLDLDEPIRHCQGADADEGARRWCATREEGRSRRADDGAMLGFVVHDVGCDLDDVGVARSSGGEGHADVAHGLRCLRRKVTSPDDCAALVDGHLSRRVDGARAGGGHHLRERRVVEEAFWTEMVELAHLSSLLPDPEHRRAAAAEPAESDTKG